MKTIIIFFSLLGVLGWLLGVFDPAPENTVIRIIDGDTVKIMGKGSNPYTVRLSGIDAPENGQAWGKKSQQLLRQLIHKKLVRVVTQKKPDRYGRTIARLYLDKIDISAYMVENGGAWVYRRYARGLSFAGLYKAEAQAKKAKRGLWGLNNPVSPWKWRKNK